MENTEIEVIEPTEEPVSTVTPQPTLEPEIDKPMYQVISESIDTQILEQQVQYLGEEVARINVQTELQTNVMLFSLGLCVSIFVCWLLYRLIKIFI